MKAGGGLQEKIGTEGEDIWLKRLSFGLKGGRRVFLELVLRGKTEGERIRHPHKGDIF